jgi:solute:Na+ symporter, SSS family
MTAIDWTLVVLLNGSVVVYALLGPRRSQSSRDWFLGGRSLAWWVVGVSAFATAIDSSDLVADAGGVYSLGIRYFVTNWVGTVGGWMLLAHFIAIPMYRAGMYTNSEYLEARFGPTARVLSSLVQVQYRTMVMANISTTLFLTFAVVGGLGPEAWWAVAVVVVLATLYTISGGSRGIALADVVQSTVMIAASLILFAVVWNGVGGWAGLTSRLAAHDPSLPDRMLHVGSEHVETADARGLPEEEVMRKLLLGGEYDERAEAITRRTPAWLACLSFVLVGMAYSIVNHEQSMRLFAAKSAWDMRMSVVVAGLLMIGMSFFNLMMGIMGRALFPLKESLPVVESLPQTVDTVYPALIRDFTTVGFKGIVVAGLLAAAISTYAGIGAAMSALLTRDVYARLIVRNRDDKHYLRVGRWLTLAVTLGSFIYMPFLLEQGMMIFYLDLVAAFVIPLLTVYLMGVFTRVHRKSGTIGLLAGVAYGAWRLIAAKLATSYGISILPTSMLDSFAAYPISLLITAGAMLLVSLVLGFEPRGGLLRQEASGWLNESQRQAENSDQAVDQPRGNALPAIFGLAVVALGLVLSFLIFW